VVLIIPSLKGKFLKADKPSQRLKQTSYSTLPKTRGWLLQGSNNSKINKAPIMIPRR
jgi:hypothetical protein